MPKYTQRTKVIINGEDVSPYVYSVNIPRLPGEVERVDLSIGIERLEVDADGVLIVRVNTLEF